MSNLHRKTENIVEESPNQEITYSKALRQINLKILNEVEMSAQEAAWFLLQLVMSKKSRDILIANTLLPEERVRVQKTVQEMNAKGLDESSTVVWKRSAIERYEDRNDRLRHITFAEYLTMYRLTNDSLRIRPAVLRYHCYPDDDIMNYKREHVMLFYPFDREVDILDKQIS